MAVPSDFSTTPAGYVLRSISRGNGDPAGTASPEPEGVESMASEPP